MHTQTAKKRTTALAKHSSRNLASKSAVWRNRHSIAEYRKSASNDFRSYARTVATPHPLSVPPAQPAPRSAITNVMHLFYEPLAIERGGRGGSEKHRARALARGLDAQVPAEIMQDMFTSGVRGTSLATFPMNGKAHTTTTSMNNASSNFYGEMLTLVQLTP